MSIGETLAAAREERGLTVQQVSESTRLRAGVITAMEHDDFRAAGGAVYARGHIRAIAKVIGADGDALVAAFDAEHAEETAPAVTEVFEVESKGRSERRGPNWSAAMAAALVAAIGVLVFQLITHNAGQSTPPSTQAGPTVSNSASSTAPTSTPTASGTPSPTSSDSAIAQLPANKVTLRMSIIGTASWVQVTNSTGTVLYTGTLASGETRYFQDHTSLSVVLGNAAAVDLVVNGQDLGAAGTDGAVFRQTFKPGDVTGSAG